MKAQLGLMGLLIAIAVTSTVLAQSAGVAVYVSAAESGNPHDEQELSGEPPLHASRSLSVHGTTATAEGYASEDTVGVIVSIEGVMPESPIFVGSATANRFGSIVIIDDETGEVMVRGWVEVSALVSGTIHEGGLGANGGGSWYFSLGDDYVEQFFESPGSHSDSATLTWGLFGPEGVPFDLHVSAGAHNGFQQTNGFAEFIASITEIVYYPELGIVDPTVTIRFQSSISTPELPGDFNADGVVSAADYVAWRDALNSNQPLLNDNGLGTPIGSAHFDLWQSHFGSVSGGGAGAADFNQIPEPSSLVILAIAVIALVGIKWGSSAL